MHGKAQSLVNDENESDVENEREGGGRALPSRQLFFRQRRALVPTSMQGYILQCEEQVWVTILVSAGGSMECTCHVLLWDTSALWVAIPNLPLTNTLASQ